MKNPDQLIPYNFEDFLSVGNNKEILFGLIQRSIEEHPPEDRIIYFCARKCTRITSNCIQIMEELESDHEEADTMLVAYAHVASSYANGILVRSPSGDIDIAISLICQELRCKICLQQH